MIGRNDPCSCGSGKKYKQCCLLKQAEDQTLQVKARHFFDRKFKLTNDLYSFLAQKQGGEWVFDHKNILPFHFSLGYYRNKAGNMWSYFCHVYDNGLRGIDWFVEERGHKYSGEDREMLERWRGMRFSCYQLVDQYEQGAVIEDIWTKERYRMPYCETMIKLPPWTAAVGMIEPYLKDWCIHGVFMWGHPDVASGVKTRVEQLQEEAAKASEQKMSPADILAANYPEMLDVCNRINSRNEQPFSHMEDTGERIFETRQYTCEYPERLEQMLLDTRDEYILAPGTEPAEGTIVISRADKLDGILDAIPADRREQLGLNEIEISKDLATIVIDKKGVTVSGWQSAELEATLELLESKLSAASGLTRVNERREAKQFPKNLFLNGYNIMTDKNLSEQEITDYGILPVLLQWIRATQEKDSTESAETLVRRKEYEYNLINPNYSNLKLLRIALGLPESPFTG